MRYLLLTPALILAACGPTAAEKREAYIAQLEAESPPIVPRSRVEECEPIAEVVNDHENRRLAMAYAREMAGDLGADALAVLSVVNNTKGIDSFIVTGIALRCRP